MKRETPLALYKGLGAVVTGIVPKMAIRFTSYEWYKQLLASKDGHVSGEATFFGETSYLHQICWRLTAYPVFQPDLLLVSPKQSLS